MKTRCFRLPFLAMALVGGLFVCEGEVLDAYWTGAGGDNKWSNAENWNPKVVPDGADGNNYRVQVSNKGTCEIEIDAGRTFRTYWFYVSGNSHVTLTGSGTLDNAELTHVGEDSSMTIDGPKVTIRTTITSGENTIKGEIHVKSGFLQQYQSLTLAGNARIFVEGGVFGSTADSTNITLTNNAEVVITGGEMTTRYVLLRGNDDGVSGGTIRLYDGVLSLTSAYSYQSKVGAGACFDFRGGIVRFGASAGEYSAMDFSGGSYALGASLRCFLPPKGTDLIVPTSMTYAKGALRFGPVAQDYSVGGTVYATNATDAAAGNVVLYSTANVTGGGTIFANRLALAPSGNNQVVNLDLAALNLGAGGIASTASRSQTVNFPNGISFGAWADWSMNETGSRKLVVKGPLAFATADALEAEKGAHGITSAGLGLLDATELLVAGGGTVNLAPADCPALIRTLEVADGTTLRFPGAVATLKAMNLKMGVGSVIEIDLSCNSYVDVSATAQIAADAKIVVTALPETLVEGKRYPIYMAPARAGGPADAEFPQIVLPDSVPAGWAVARTANCAYLADGNVYPSLSGENPVWTGAGADNKYLTAENWISTSEKWTGTPDSGSAVKFYSTSNNLIETVVNVDADQKLGNMEFGNNVGPFVFTNKCLRFAYPSSSAGWTEIYYSVWNNGNFPVLLENDVGTYSPNTLGLQFQSVKQGSVDVLGDSLDVIPLQFGGDVRLGGNYTASRIICNPKYGATYVGRRSSLTVLPGGRLTVTEQAGDLWTTNRCEFFYAVATNGTMTVGGTDFTFVKPATHFVDGTLAVTCPLVTPVVQTFRGDGTLRLDDARGNAEDCLGGIRLEGNLTFVPGAWADRLTLSVRDNVTIAPAADWTYANSTNLVLDGHSKLTFATGGGDVTLAAPIVSDGEVAVTGKGRLTLGAAGTSLWKVTCADGAAVGATDELLAAATDEKGFADILRVRKPDDSLVFADDLKTKMRYEVETDSTVYSAKRKCGLMLLVR